MSLFWVAAGENRSSDIIQAIQDVSKKSLFFGLNIITKSRKLFKIICHKRDESSVKCSLDMVNWCETTTNYVALDGENVPPSEQRYWQFGSLQIIKDV